MNALEENIIREFYYRERTELGKSVIRQLADALGVRLDD